MSVVVTSSVPTNTNTLPPSVIVLSLGGEICTQLVDKSAHKQIALCVRLGGPVSLPSFPSPPLRTTIALTSVSVSVVSAFGQCCCLSPSLTSDEQDNSH